MCNTTVYSMIDHVENTRLLDVVDEMSRDDWFVKPVKPIPIPWKPSPIQPIAATTSGEVVSPLFVTTNTVTGTVQYMRCP